MERKKLAIIVDAPGPAEFIKPVIPLLKQTCDVVVVTVLESSARILAEFNPIACESESAVAALCDSLQYDVLVPATSSLTLGPFVIPEFVKRAAADKKRIICFQDYWANHRKQINRGVMRLWDVAITEDEIARRYLLEDGYEGKIVIAGNPAFEKFKYINKEQERKRIREKLGIPEDEFVILHAGTGTPQSWHEDEVTFEFFLRAVASMMKRPIVIAEPHPRDTNPIRYARLAHKLGVILFPVDALTDDVLAAADVAVGMYSTALIHATYLRVPAVSILLQNAGMKRLEEVALADFPPNTSGACIGIYSSETRELKEIFERIRDDVNIRNEIREKQEKFALLPKESFAKNVADAICGNI